MSPVQIEKLFGPTWVDFMTPFVNSPEFAKILADLKAAKTAGDVIYPAQKNIFRAFIETPLDHVRVIILGQDPYPGEDLANGLAFAHANNMTKPASMVKIMAAVEKDGYGGLALTEMIEFKPDLMHWAKQGVLLLNSSLTLKAGTPGSHAEIWKPFTTYVVKTLSEVKKAMIWNCWGKEAQSFMTNVDIFQNFVLHQDHPSNAARQNKEWEVVCFSKTNAIIVGNRLGDKIKW